MCEGDQHQICRTTVYVGICHYVYSNGKPVCGGVTSTRAVRTTSARLSDHGRRANQSRRTVDIISDGLPIPCSSKAIERGLAALGCDKERIRQIRCCGECAVKTADHSE